MSTLTAEAPTPPKKRDDVLTKVQDMLHETLEKALHDLAALDEERAESATTQPKLAACLQGLENRLQSAQATAAEMELALSADEKAMREYMRQAEAMRQKLAAWTGRAIG